MSADGVGVREVGRDGLNSVSRAVVLKHVDRLEGWTSQTVGLHPWSF
jgi:hypothetical protein